MFNNFSFKIAWRYFSAKKNERLVNIISGFSLLGVTLGVAALIVVTAVMAGFRSELTRNIIGLNSDLTILPAGNNKVIADSDQLISKIEQLPQVHHINKLINGQVLATSKHSSSGALIKGIDLKDLKRKKQIANNIIQGDLSQYNNDNSIIIGQELAFALNVFAGDSLKLVSTNSASTILGNIPRSKTFTVVAVFASGMFDYDSATIIMPLKAAQNYLSLHDNINSLEIYTDDPHNSAVNIDVIIPFLNHEVRIQSWMDTHRQLLNALEVEKVAMFVILSLIILVAAFNIISSLFMLVKDKTTDIAIFRTIGASKFSILLIFIINGSFIGMIGTFLGVVLGVSFSLNINNIKLFLEGMTGINLFDAAVYFLYNLPAEVHYSDVIRICLMSLSLSVLATIYPAYRAAKLDPIEVMRNE